MEIQAAASVWQQHLGFIPGLCNQHVRDYYAHLAKERPELGFFALEEERDQDWYQPIPTEWEDIPF